jgi:hypothetical protein
MEKRVEKILNEYEEFIKLAEKFCESQV